MKRISLQLSLAAILVIEGGLIANLVVASNLEDTIPVVVIATPAASPLPGSYNSAQQVIIAASGSASIHYAVGGDTVSCSSGTTYSAPIAVTVSETVTAISCYGSSYSSSVVSFRYLISGAGGGGGSGAGSTESSGTVGAGGGGGTPGASAPAVSLTFKNSDVNKDGVTNEYDMAVMMADWGSSAGGVADLTGNGVVDEYDFSILMSNWES